jgi:hypothetical protein
LVDEPGSQAGSGEAAIQRVSGKIDLPLRRRQMGTKISFGMRTVIALLVIVSWLSISSSRMAGQNTGKKAVWNSIVTPSTVWVDASAWWTSGVPDLCSYISTKILTSNYNTAFPNGTVIDARGLVIKNTATTCAVDPFSALTAPPPSTTILLPSGYIDITVPWTIPNNTRIVGDEQGTRIRANFDGPYMIEMGGTEPTSQTNLCPSNICTSVGLEHLFLDGSLVVNGVPYLVGGIDNKYSQAGSYVNDVNLWSLAGTGLSIGTGATNSGPYSNISYVASTDAKADCQAGDNCPVCIDLEAQTQGVHGLTCNGNGSTVSNPHAGIYVNASNNSIEDVHIESFWDGIEVGNLSGTVANVLLSNITGTTTGTRGFTTNTVHLCGANPWNSLSFGNCGGSHGTVTDITVLHAVNSSGPKTTTVADDVSQNAIVSCNTTTPGCANPLSTAIYALGEPDGGTTAAYSKFTSSPSTRNGDYQNNPPSSDTPTWGFGNKLPPTGAECSPVGAIYSQTTTTTSPKLVYVCVPVINQNYGQWNTIR